MSVISPLLLVTRRNAALARLLVRLLRSLKIKVSAGAALLGAGSLLGLGLIGFAWRRNRAIGGAPLWPTLLPAISAAALLTLGVSLTALPVVDLTATERGAEYDVQQASATPAPLDLLDRPRMYLSSTDPRMVTMGFQVAAEMGESAVPLIDQMQQVLVGDPRTDAVRMEAFLKVVPIDRQETLLKTIGLTGNSAAKAESLCALSARGNREAIERLGAFVDGAGGASEDEIPLRRSMKCVVEMPLQNRILMTAHIRQLLERMCDPAHARDDAWRSAFPGSGDPLASNELFREAMKAYWSISPSEQTKQSIWGLLENAPAKTRNRRRTTINEIALPWTVAK